jgi:hypothetical protein
MLVIHKFVLRITDFQEVPMPEGAKILSVQNQRDDISVWALCDSSVEYVARKFLIVATGNPIPVDLKGWEYLSTVQHFQFVWHVFHFVGGTSWRDKW